MIVSANYYQRIRKYFTTKLAVAEEYSETCQTSKMEHFTKIVSVKKPLASFAKCCILDCPYVASGSYCFHETLV